MRVFSTSAPLATSASLAAVLYSSLGGCGTLEPPTAERATITAPAVDAQATGGWLMAGADAVVRSPSPANRETCAARRRRTATELGSGTLIVEAGPDPDDARFIANDDFYWLTGVEAREAVLVVVADEGTLTAEVLFLPAFDARHELWNGPRLAPGQHAVERTGVAETRSLEELEAGLEALTAGAKRVIAGGDTLGALASPGAPSIHDFLRELQQVKDAGEIDAMRAAVDITQAALADAMRVAVPGAWEFTAEAALESGFRRRGAATLAFPSICGSGPNTCFLHYRDNERQLVDGDLLLMDVGAKYHHYCADVTRTIPVNGRFTPRQREVYDAVYEASRKAAALLKPGARLQDADELARDVLAEHGFGRKDFPHSIGHGLGLEVHDAPSRRTVLEPGMVVTIEPGLYLPGEAIGIRIEDDYLITESGAELLSDDLPSQADELEAFLATLRRKR